MSVNRPVMVIVAGANGSGKSSNTVQFVREGYDVIDPDRIARNLSPNAPEKMAVSAGKSAINRARENIQNGISFSIETTLSSKGVYQRLVNEAKKQSFIIKLAYISTEHPSINIERIKERVANGGHHVPDVDVVRRYERSLENVSGFFNQADEVCFVDNSRLSSDMRVQLHAKGSEQIHKIAPQNELCQWVTKALGQDVIEKLYACHNKHYELGNSIVSKHESAYKSKERSQQSTRSPDQNHKKFER
ncbi:TPA: zeta toxin family protein [Vibrio campbellii]|nr:zeta toxin family protein [Vibrio campbellii]